MKIYNWFTILFLFLASCQSADTLKTVSFEDKYSLEIPAYLTESNILNEDASLQFQNDRKGLYFIVIEEPIDEFNAALEEYELTDVYPFGLNGYSELLIDGLEEEITLSEKSNVVKTTINNLPARLITFKGVIGIFKGFYSIGHFEGKDKYYQVMAWTASDLEAKHRMTMKKIIHSFKENL